MREGVIEHASLCDRGKLAHHWYSDLHGLALPVIKDILARLPHLRALRIQGYHNLITDFNTVVMPFFTILSPTCLLSLELFEIHVLLRQVPILADFLQPFEEIRCLLLEIEMGVTIVAEAEA